MLQFSAMLYTTARLAPRSSWRLTALVACNSSTAVSNELPAAASINVENSTKFSKLKTVSQKEQESKETDVQTTLHTTDKRNNRKKHSSEDDTVFSKQFPAAKSVNDLLDLALLPNLSTHNALKLISSITIQMNSGKSQTVNIEDDERFIHLRKIVKNSGETKTHEISDNLSKYSQLSTPAMIAVIASLREQRNRHTPLLKMLSHNIVKYNVELNLKQCATLLYSMAILNFPDKVLLEKITYDLLECIPESKSAAINKSIITSLGFLRCKNMDVLDAFCDTFFKKMNYTFMDYSSILQTFAALHYKSEKVNEFVEKFAEHVYPQMSWIEWLDIVWSLAVLDAVKSQHVKSVLEPAFIKNLSTTQKPNISKILKLLNINAVAQFVLNDYTGPLLEKDSELNSVPITRSKEKQLYINTLFETLTEILPSSSYFKTNVNTNMGFLLDVEYRINDQHKLVKVEDWNEQSNDSCRMRRIAIMMHDYHDYCIGQNDLIGSTYLYTQLLKARGYDLISVSYENFSLQDNIKKRVKYLKECMNSIHKIESVNETK